MVQRKPLLWLFFSLSLVSVLFSFSNNVRIYRAEDKADESFQKAVKDFAGESLLDKVLGLKSNRKKEETIESVLSYLLIPGGYADDISKAVTKEDLDNTVYKESGDKKSLCAVSDSQPQNLLNHNCDLPTLATSVGQKVASTFNSYGIKNGEATTAKSNWGVPSNLPGGKVPSDESKRGSKYTGLELYGYNLQFINYTGEWDDIQVSTEARLLANYGFLHRTKLAVSSIWNGAKGGFTAVIEKFDWNPIKYASNIINGTVSSVLWTSIDTGDYNIAASHAWTRPEFANTLYNVYYMNTKEISEKANAEYLKQIKEILKEALGNHPQVQTLFDVDYSGDSYPKFVYDENKVKKVPKKDDKGQVVRDKKNNIVYVEEKVPEEEQLADWRSTPSVQNFFSTASSIGVDSCSGAKKGSELKSCYEDSYNKKVQEVINAYENSGATLDVTSLGKKVESIFKKKNIHSIPSTGIAHYVCGTEEGLPTADSLINYKYVYLAENTPTGESLNPSCSPVRPSIKGGYYGTGNGTSDDTRWQQFNYIRFNSVRMDLGGSFFNNIAQIVTKLTVTIVDFSYSNIIEVLELDTIVESMMISFRDTLFYPLLILVFALGGLMILLEIFKKGSMINSFKALLSMFLTFVLGVILVSKPSQIIKLVDEVPTKVDNFILSFMINNPTLKHDPVCSSNSALRTLECKIWKINIFTPYVMGQWGTSYDNLDASDFNNTNSDLVGKGSVNMGGGTVVNNWALYQLDKTKAGTITEDNENSNVTSRALYKVVDLQFGPNNGAKSDSRYAKHWSGLNGRGYYRAGSALTSVALAIPIIGMSIAKLELNFTFALMLMWMPVMMLIGILPKGRMNMIKYGEKLLAIFVKRMVITMMLSFTLYFITLAIESSNSYSAVFIGSVSLAFASILYWKDLVNLFNVTSEAGTSWTNGQIGGLRTAIKQSNLLPNSLDVRVNATVRGARDTVVGTVAGGAAGVINQIQDMSNGYRRTVKSSDGKRSYRTNAILQGMIDGGASGINRATSFAFSKQKRMGYGLYDLVKKAHDAGIKNYKDQFRLEGNQAQERISEIRGLLRGKVTILEQNRINQTKQFQNDYKKLIAMAHERHIPLTKTGHLDFDMINQILYDDQGNLRETLNDRRFDNAFVGQIFRVVQSSANMNKTKHEHESYVLAQDYINEVVRDNFNTDDKELFYLLKSLNGAKKVRTDNQGNPIKDERGNILYDYMSIDELTDNFVDKINGLKNYSSLDKIKSGTITDKFYEMTNDVLSTSDNFVDKVIKDKDLTTKEFIKEILTEKNEEDTSSLTKAESLEYNFDHKETLSQTEQASKVEKVEDKLASRTVINTLKIINQIDDSPLAKLGVTNTEILAIRQEAVIEANAITQGVIDKFNNPNGSDENVPTIQDFIDQRSATKVIEDVKDNILTKDNILKGEAKLNNFRTQPTIEDLNPIVDINPKDEPVVKNQDIVSEFKASEKVIQDVIENVITKETPKERLVPEIKIPLDTVPDELVESEKLIVPEEVVIPETKASEKVIADVIENVIIKETPKEVVVPEEVVPEPKASEKVIADVIENVITKETLKEVVVPEPKASEKVIEDVVEDIITKETPKEVVVPEEVVPEPKASEKVIEDVIENVIAKETPKEDVKPVESEEKIMTSSERVIEDVKENIIIKEELFKEEEMNEPDLSEVLKESKENNFNNEDSIKTRESENKDKPQKLSEKEEAIQKYKQQIIDELLNSDREDLATTKFEEDSTIEKAPKKKSFKDRFLAKASVMKDVKDNSEFKSLPKRPNRVKETPVHEKLNRKNQAVAKEQAGLKTLAKAIKAMKDVEFLNKTNKKDNE